MNIYAFYWLDGSKKEVKASSFKEALSKMGIQPGAVRAIDFYTCRTEETEEESYVWDEARGRWKHKERYKIS